MKTLYDWRAIVTDATCLSSICNVLSFSHLRCFHLCRPSNVGAYYNDGIRLVSRDTIRQQFSDIFSELPQDALDSAISNLNNGPSTQEVFVGVDCQFLLQHCGHYCVYGSEYLTGLAAHIGSTDNQDRRQRLKLTGRPTVIVLDVPFDQLPPSDAAELIVELRRVASGDNDNVILPDMLLDYGISFNHAVPPEWVVEHYHPESIWDPLLKEEYVYFS